MEGKLEIVSGLVFVVAYIPLIRFSFTGEDRRPSKATWLIWATVDILLTFSMAAEGTLNGQTLGATIGACIVALISLVKGKQGWSRLDKAALAGAGLGLAVWALSGDAVIGMAASLAVMLIGAVPSFVRSWKDPKSESKLAWTMMLGSCLLTLPTVADWGNFAQAAQPAVFTFIEGVMVFNLILAPLVRKAWASRFS